VITIGFDNEAKTLLGFLTEQNLRIQIEMALFREFVYIYQQIGRGLTFFLGVFTVFGKSLSLDTKKSNQATGSLNYAWY
jgi:hypothetical protein